MIYFYSYPTTTGDINIRYRKNVKTVPELALCYFCCVLAFFSEKIQFSRVGFNTTLQFPQTALEYFSTQGDDRKSA